MSDAEERRYTISEVSEATGVTTHTLRQWEKQIAKLRPKRTRTDRRYYSKGDIDIVRAVMYLVRHKGMKLDAVNRYITQGDFQGAVPRSPEKALDLIAQVKAEVQAMLAEIRGDE